MNKKNISQFSKDILEKIKDEDVKMKPKAHFVLKSVLYIVASSVVFLFIVYLSSFIVFFSKMHGVEHAPGFGLVGLQIFLTSLPWLLVLGVLLLIVVLELLVRHFEFGYRKPILYSLFAVVLIVSLGSGVLAKTSFHNSLHERSLEHRLPVGAGLYEGYIQRQQGNIFRGEVEEVHEHGFELESHFDEELFVEIDESTRIRPPGEVEEDDLVVVIGKRIGDKIIAKGVQIIGDDDFKPERRKGRTKPPEHKLRLEKHR
jgi:hypothetical protein